MKISLNLNQNETYTPEGVEIEKTIERDAQEAKKGDWEAKARLTQTFMPLLTSLARKRSQDTAMINRCIEAGKEGLVAAARHYKPATGAKFQIFALSYIENAMDRVGKPGFFARLFGRS